MQDGSLRLAAFLVIAGIVVIVLAVATTEWSRARQFRENLKANGRRK
jgi:hypothetical protein